MTTVDIPDIVKCKNEFLKRHNGTLDEIKQSTNERLTREEKIENKINYPNWKKEFDDKLQKYAKLSPLNHDVSDDYKMRDYVVDIVFQKEEFKGHIYYEYGHGGYGLNNSIMSSILNFIDELDAQTVNEYNKTCHLLNDMNMMTDNKNNIKLLYITTKKSLLKFALILKIYRIILLVIN